MPPRRSFFAFHASKKEKKGREERIGGGGNGGAIIHVITQYCQYASAVDQYLHGVHARVYAEIISCWLARARPQKAEIKRHKHVYGSPDSQRTDHCEIV